MTIAQILSEEVVQALGWTVVHSLWQAALLAAVAGVGMLLMHRRPARERYLLSVSALAGVLLWAVFTFLSYYEPASELPVVAIVTGEMTALPLVSSTGDWSGGMAEQFTAYFSRNAPLIATLWILGMTFFLLRMLGALMYANQLKRRHVSPLPEKWQQTLLHFARRIGIRRAVRLLESAAIKTPMTIGFLKPVILLPIGMVNNLSPQQVEAILAHELAHIYRSDFLINIFQAIIETLFYFNPAVWWLSAAVRAEREDCCDDIAILHCNNSLDYAKALVSVQEWGRPHSGFALAFAGGKNRLLNRVRRILNHPQNKSNIMEKFTATCLMLLAVLALTISAAYPDQNSPDTTVTLSEVDAETPVVPTDSLPKGNARINLEKNGKSLEAKVKDGVITYLKVDGKEIPPADYSSIRNHGGRSFWGSANAAHATNAVYAAPPAPMAPMPPMPPVPPAPPADFWGDGATHIFKELDANGNTFSKLNVQMEQHLLFSNGMTKTKPSS
jgi:bla regulator protein BlaR1